MSWPREFDGIVRAEACVLVTLCQLSGSAPRESGSRMIVTQNGIAGSVGGGNLEFKACGKARELLAGQAAGYQEQEVYGLGPALNQCCGGAVALLFEVYGPGAPDWLDALMTAQESGEPVVFASKVSGAACCKQNITSQTATSGSMPVEIAEAARDLLQAGRGGANKERIITVNSHGQTWWLEPTVDDTRHVMLFGAGHVGQAVAQALLPLPFRVTWVDSREGLFPPDLPASFRAVRSDHPADEVASAEVGSIFVIMTHSHQMDEDICLQVLQRGDHAWLGLIGSETKRRRFVHRLGQGGIGPAELERLVCPIGLSGIRGKQPATIALSLVAQLMILVGEAD
jgi:xanthine dehydrogenase accessory factor